MTAGRFSGVHHLARHEPFTPLRRYEANTGRMVVDVQRQIRHPALHWMGATLDGRVEATGAVFEAKFMLPWSFSEEAAVEKYAPWRMASPLPCSGSSRRSPGSRPSVSI